MTDQREHDIQEVSVNAHSKR